MLYVVYSKVRFLQNIESCKQKVLDKCDSFPISNEKEAIYGPVVSILPAKATFKDLIAQKVKDENFFFKLVNSGNFLKNSL